MQKALFVLLLSLLALAPACVKTEFDEPPIGGTPVNLDPTKTIAELKAMYTGTRTTIADSTIIIKGQVVMDDKSGNFYKTIVIQDATAGIEIKFNDGYLYNKYPLGRSVLINCRNLIISDYNGVLSLNGGTVVENGVVSTIGLSSAQADQQVFKGSFDTKIQPKVKKINELLSSDISTLITLENVEFASADVNKTYSDPIGQTSINRVVEDCNTASVLLRSSGFSNFAAALTPAGKGSLTGVYSVYRQDQQFYIRDTADVDMKNPRCGVNTNLTGMSIADLRALYTGANTSGPQDKKITGVVISDRTFANTDPKNMILQDGDKGIAVRFSAAHTFDKGDKVDVDVSGVELSEFNGLMQLNAVPANNALKVGAGTVTPKEVTIATIKANLNAYESTLVKVKAATFTATGTYSGNKGIMDATGDMTHFTRTAATFAASALPSGTIEMVAIVGEYTTTTSSTLQLSVRSVADVTGGTPGGGTGGTVVTSINEPFDGITNNSAFAATGWKNVAVKGTRVWNGKTFQTDKYVQATSFNSTDPEEEMWLISPPIDLATQKTLNFRTATSFWKHDGLTIMVSTNFDGTNVGTATWAPLTATLAGSTSGDNTWVPSGAITLPTAPKAYIGFRYTGNAAANTSTYRIDDITVQ
jgi:Family of unknown function (DUF5689)